MAAKDGYQELHDVQPNSGATWADMPSLLWSLKVGMSLSGISEGSSSYIPFQPITITGFPICVHQTIYLALIPNSTHYRNMSALLVIVTFWLVCTLEHLVIHFYSFLGIEPVPISYVYCLFFTLLAWFLFFSSLDVVCVSDVVLPLGNYVYMYTCTCLTLPFGSVLVCTRWSPCVIMSWSDLPTWKSRIEHFYRSDWAQVVVWWLTAPFSFCLCGTCV